MDLKKWKVMPVSMVKNVVNLNVIRKVDRTCSTHRSNKEIIDDMSKNSFPSNLKLRLLATNRTIPQHAE
jgi:hypothetical protein